MTRHKPSAPYLAAIERRLGADLFGPSTTRSAAARLLAELAGPETERDWLAHVDSDNATGAEGILDDLVTRHSLAGALISRARTVARVRPEPGGSNPLTDLERALTALDHAMNRVPAEYKRELKEKVYERVERIVLDVASDEAERRTAEEERRRAMEGPGRFVGAPEPVAAS
jgi:hypothetical protein